MKRKKNIIISGIVVVFLVLMVLFFIFLFPYLQYKKANRLVVEQNYLPAISLFQELGDFKDSKLLLDKTQKEYVRYLVSMSDFDEAALYAEQKNVFNTDQVSALRRAAAITSGKYEEIVNGKIGDTVTFGKYVQSGTDFSPLEWVIIDKSGDNLLLITKYCIERKMMGGDNWEEAKIRNELNSSMINAMFDNYEQAFILETNHESKVTIDFDFENPTLIQTEDKLFLLSADEAIKYFPSKTDRLVQPTEKCSQKYNFEDSSRNVTWATRDSEYYSNGGSCFVTVVYWANDPIERAPCGSMRTTEDFFLRPAMWITINTDILE